MTTDVFVIGAGFSANLGFPLTSELLHFVFNKIDRKDRRQLSEIVSFHFPGFNPKDPKTYPNIEELLTRIQINKVMFEASRPNEGNFKKETLIKIEKSILQIILQNFDEITGFLTTPDWLHIFIDYIKKNNSVLISFNWDLVIDREIKISDKIDPTIYSALKGNSKSPKILKPHGSLNWHLASSAKTIKKDKKQVLWSPPEEIKSPNEDQEKIFLFKEMRLPVSGYDRVYVPWIIPPTYTKSFNHPFIKQVWRDCTDALTRAKRVFFLGYSLPRYDLHSEFIFRCGIHAQKEGGIKGKKRKNPSGLAEFFVINPDLLANNHISNTLGIKCRHMPITVATWIRSGGLQAK